MTVSEYAWGFVKEIYPPILASALRAIGMTIWNGCTSWTA